MDNAVQRFNNRGQRFFIACGGMLRGRPQAGISSAEGQSHAKSEAVWDLMVIGNCAWWKISCIQGTFISKGILTTCVQLNHSFWNPLQWWYLFFTHSLLSPEDIKLPAIYMLALRTDPEGDSCFSIYEISWIRIKINICKLKTSLGGNFV